MSEITERLKTAIADRYTAELVPGELFSIQSTIVEQVASALGVTLRRALMLAFVRLASLACGDGRIQPA